VLFLGKALAWMRAILKWENRRNMLRLRWDAIARPGDDNNADLPQISTTRETEKRPTATQLLSLGSGARHFAVAHFQTFAALSLNRFLGKIFANARCGYSHLELGFQRVRN